MSSQKWESPKEDRQNLMSSEVSLGSQKIDKVYTKWEKE